MPATQTNPVSSTVRYEATGPDGGNLTALNLGPDSCYYGTSTVTSGSNEGTLTTGQSVTFAPSKFFISAGSSRVQISTPTPVEQARVYDKDNGEPGMIAPGTPGWAYTTQLQIANRGYVMRFVPSRQINMTLVAYYVSTFATTDDPVAVAIYDANLATVLATSGAVTGKVNTTAGVKTIPLAYALQPGIVYYASFTYGAVGGTAATLLAANFVTSSAGYLFGQTPPKLAFDAKDTVHPPTGAWGALGGAISTCPVLVIREV